MRERGHPKTLTFGGKRKIIGTKFLVQRNGSRKRHQRRSVVKTMGGRFGGSPKRGILTPMKNSEWSSTPYGLQAEGASLARQIKLPRAKEKKLPVTKIALLRNGAMGKSGVSWKRWPETGRNRTKREGS